MSVMNQLDKCRTCKHYSPSNEYMRAAGHKVIVGDFCLKFKWNLGRVKNWEQKTSNQKVINFKQMTLVPMRCYE